MIEASDLPLNIKKKVIEELKRKKFVLDDEKPIGKGAFSYVYKVKSTVTYDLRACKVLVFPEDLPEKTKKNLTKLVQKEIIRLEILAEDEIIAAIKFSKVFPEFVMIVMEYCAGGSLEKYVVSRNGETMDESSIKSFAHQILSAMFEYANKSIIHRAIKPENILIDEFGRLKLSDFSMVGETNGHSKISSQVIAENRRYLSPELENGLPQSIKSDIWALGVILLELAYGRDSFKTSKINGMDSTKIREEFRSRGGYSSEMVEVIAKCFERESIDRASVDDLLKDKWLGDANINTAGTAKKSGNNN